MRQTLASAGRDRRWSEFIAQSIAGWPTFRLRSGLGKRRDPFPHLRSSQTPSLILGDCREVLETVGRVDAVVTDPPYGMKWDGRGSQPEKTATLGMAAPQITVSL